MRRLLTLSLVLCSLYMSACEREEPPSPSSVLTFSPTEEVNSWGRVSALCVGRGRVWTGHESGWIAVWHEVNAPSKQPTLSLKSSWLAHEGAVRTLTCETQGERALWSLGADGSWASWSEAGQALSRGRAPEQRANVALSLPSASKGGAWLIGSDRGVLSRVEGGARVWRTAGEHRRAVFDVALSTPQSTPQHKTKTLSKAQPILEALSVGADGWLRRWRVSDGTSLGARAAHEGWATRLIKLTPPTGSAVWVTGGSDGAVRLWPLDVARGVVERPPPQGVQAHPRDLTSLIGAWPWLVSGAEGGEVSLYRATQQGEQPIELSLFKRLSLFEGPVLALALNTPTLNTPTLTLWVGGGARATDLKRVSVLGGKVSVSAVRFELTGSNATRAEER
jgi:WD40 repeat protein